MVLDKDQRIPDDIVLALVSSQFWIGADMLRPVWYLSGALVTQRAAKQSTITIGTKSHAFIEIENHATLFHGQAWIAGACAQQHRTTWWPYSS